MTKCETGAGPDRDFAWNPRAHQPHRTLSKWQRNREVLAYGKHHFRMIWHSLRGLPRVMNCYRSRLPHLFSPSGEVPRGFGVSTDSEPALLEKIAKEVPGLKADCVLVRVPVWQLNNLKLCRSFLAEMRLLGINTMVAILQDRQSVLDKGYWRKALENIFHELEEEAAYYEIGHAWNRMKWGVRSYEQYLDLIEEAEHVRDHNSGIRFVGPAAIDFEYVYTMGVLMHPRRRPRFDAVSSLLYVDRRGAPENRQSGFDLPHKALLMRAITDSSLGESVPFWITETNWPLAVPGEYSPTSMKESIGVDKYADYMVRYFILTLSSGMVDRVYWWQVAAHGYGLIDDLNGRWDRRPAWHAFRTMVALLGGSRIENFQSSELLRAGTFRTMDQRFVTVAWSLRGNAKLGISFPVSEMVTRDGDVLPPPQGESVLLSSSPVYLIHG